MKLTKPSFLKKITVPKFIAEIIGKPEFLSEKTGSRTYFFYHGLIAAFFFSNFFLLGQVLICSTDMININFPLLIDAKRAFLRQEIPLWNPYVMGGVSSFLGGVSPFFSPDNWIHFLVPEKYFFQTATALSFLRMWLVGGLAYFIFAEEFKSRRWGFFSACAYQLCGYTIWTVTAYDTLSLLLYFTLSVYLIWSAENRRSYLTYAFLTFAMVTTVFCSNVAYGPYALLAIPILLVYRASTREKSTHRNHLLVLVSFSLVTTALIAMLRLLPTWEDLKTANRVAHTLDLDFQSLSTLALRIFVPEIFGVSYRSSVEILQSLFPAAAKKFLHTHWAMPHYFGAVSGLLAAWGLLTGRARFWAFYVLVSLSAILFAQPFDGLLRILLYPAYHSFSLQIFLPLGFCAWVGYVGKSIEENETPAEYRRAIPLWIFGLVSLILFFGLTWFAKYRFSVTPMALQIGVAVGLAGIGSTLFIFRNPLRILSQTTLWLLLVSMAGAFLLMVFLRSENATFLSHSKILLASIGLLLCVAILFLLKLSRPELPSKAIFRLLLPLALGCVGISLFPWSNEIDVIPTRHQDMLIALMGTLRFAVVALTFTALVFWRGHLKKEWVFPVLLSFLLLEQLPASKIHSHIVINPFYAGNPFPEAIYPRDETGKRATLDHRNYRVNYPNTMVKNPVYGRIWGNEEIISSIFAAYEIRSYGGYYNAVPKKYELLLSYFKQPYAYGGVKTDSSDERFLDLLGVRYQFENGKNRVRTRATALARVTLFNHYEVATSSAAALRRLREPSFVPQDTVILESKPELVNDVPRGHAEKLPVIGEFHNQVEVKYRSAKEAILLFNDNFHPDWKAFIDGVSQPIFPANYAFMGIKVPDGDHQVIFRFEPRAFYWGTVSASAGLLLFILIFALLFAARQPEKKRGFAGGLSPAAPV